MIAQAIKLPIAIAIKLCQIFNEVQPAIKLPDQTPVSGSGMATNPPSNNNFLKVEFVRESLESFLLYRSCTKPVKNRFLIFRVKSMTGRAGTKLPMNAQRNAAQAGKTFSAKICADSANGIAILPSNPGMIAIKMTAKKAYSPKNEPMASKIKSPPLLYYSC